MEAGTVHYADSFDMIRIVTNDVDKVNSAVDELVEDSTGVKTLVLDSMTAYYDSLLDKHRRRLRIKKGNINYDLQPADYAPIKADMKSFVNKLVALDLNIIATAGVRTAYSQDPSKFMEVTGTTADSEKNLNRLFDVVVEVKYNPSISEERTAIVHKDRTNKLTREFPFSYAEFTKQVDMKDLERESVILNTKMAMVSPVVRSTEITLNGNVVKTAGVTAEQLEVLMGVEIPRLGADFVVQQLSESFGFSSLLDLHKDEAALFISTLSTLTI